jgi:hypothetical protein
MTINEQKLNCGIAFQSQDCYTTDYPKAPDYRGEINVDGHHYQISIWEHKTKNGEIPI